MTPQNRIVPQITAYAYAYAYTSDASTSTSTSTNIGITAQHQLNMKEIGIFPAAGGLGGSTYRHLLGLVPNDHVTLICRYPEKIETKYREAGVVVRRATYESTPQELELAFSGLDVLFLVSYPSHVHEYRVKVSGPSLDRKRERGEVNGRMVG